MDNMNDRWDLSYLYKSFDEDAFRNDLASLKEDAESGMAQLQDASLSPRVKLEQDRKSVV